MQAIIEAWIADGGQVFARGRRVIGITAAGQVFYLAGGGNAPRWAAMAPVGFTLDVV